MRAIALTLSLTLLGVGCGETTVTKVDYLETDTTLVSTDSENRGTEPYLGVSKSTSLEERALVKLPTGKRNELSHIKDLLSNPSTVVLLPFIIYIEIIRDILGCPASETLKAENLTSAKLVLDVLQNDEGSSLTGKVDIALLAKGWWYNATWTRAHPFSEAGKWTTGGGDVDSSFTPVTATLSSNTVEFDVTTYFRTLISQSEPTHYGLVLRAAQSSLLTTRFASTQYSTKTKRPRLVSVYTASACAAVNSALGSPLGQVYYLGDRDGDR